MNKKMTMKKNNHCYLHSRKYKENVIVVVNQATDLRNVNLKITYQKKIGISTMSN